ncbi:hypothetical protein BSPWISOX_173 [uncultured Gammaproteobacteria bacterium]|nr:hypothetical protein BSPWISOX_173 [uncultured Gammaproteobacteria bacterium]
MRKPPSSRVYQTREREGAITGFSEDGLKALVYQTREREGAITIVVIVVG